MIIDPDNPLAVEIRQEMAEAHFAACKKWPLPLRR